RQAIDEEDAVEVVDLVLYDTRQQTLGLALVPVALEVGEAEPDGARTLDVLGDLGDTEAAFLVRNAIPGEPVDGGVDQHQTRADVPPRLVVGDLGQDDQAFGNADLRRGQADPRLAVHRLEHVLDEGTQRVQGFGDRLRLVAQHGGPVRQDRPNCDDATPL